MLLYAHVHQFITKILGVDADALLSVAFANPRFSNNQLHVNSEARFAERPMETVLGRTLFSKMEEVCRHSFLQHVCLDESRADIVLLRA